MINQYDPLAVFQQPENKGGICSVVDATAQSNVAAGSNVVIPAGGAGKKARIVSMNYSAVGATAGLMALTSGSTIFADNQPPNSVQPVVLPFNPAGWCDSAANTAITLVTTVTGNFSARYYYYTA